MSEPRKRPTRACTAKTPSRLAPLAPTVERSTPQKKQTGGNEEPNAPLVFSIPAATPAEKDRWDLRSMWELASVINFFNTFRPILKINEFTAEELETALLTSNSLLMDIHVALLKGIHPSNRNSITEDNWVSFLHKKLKDRWTKVAQLPFPLAGCQGDEAAVYKGFDPTTRLIILRAVCETRLDQDDVRAYMEEPVKKGHVSSFRKERSGANSLGTIYWFENDLVSGHRLYREILKPKGKEHRGRAASPPPPSQWETLASNLDEFQSVADTLLSSKSRQEIGLGKKLKQEVLPVLEAIQKKKERVLKRQQRQASLLDSSLQENGLAGGRAKRDRKPVTYTFDEYDRSINEAIKFTRKGKQSPERAAELTNGHGVANGHTDQLKKAKSSRKERLGQMIEKEPFTIADHSDENEHSEPQENTSDIAPEVSEGAASTDRDSSDDSGTQNFGRRSRRRTRSLRYSESDYVDAAYAEEDDLYSDDEIEGEAIYDEEFLRNRKRRRGYASSGDEEYRADEDEDEDVDLEDDLDGGSYSEEEPEQVPEEGQERDEEVIPRSRRKARKSKAVEDLGLRRSKRATRSKVNYKAYEDSELEEDDDYPPEQPEKWKQNGEEKASPSSFEDADYSMESGSHPSSNETSDREEQTYTSKAAVAVEQDHHHHQQQQDEEDEEEEENDTAKRDSDNHMNGGDDGLDRKQQLRFLDLNECAPTDSPRDWMTSLKSIATGFLDDGGDITPREELV